jgi:HEPN domain-containing protein
MKSEAAEWFRYAEDDFAVGSRLLTDYPRNSVWSHHQAAEKFLKALLIQAGVDFPKTHDCTVLFNLLTQADKSVVREACIHLSGYGPAQRYPGGTPITVADGHAVQASSAKVREYARKHCGHEAGKG